MDKLQKIREEVARIQLYTQSEVLKQVLDYIDEVQKEPVSEDLEKAALMHFKDVMEYENKNGLKMANMTSFKAGANWQKEKDAKLIINAKEDGYRLGLATMKQQMMENAVDAVVKIDAGGYPYVDRTIELYDYDKDVPLAKRGDKVKILVIKED